MFFRQGTFKKYFELSCLPEILSFLIVSSILKHLLRYQLETMRVRPKRASMT